MRMHYKNMAVFSPSNMDIWGDTTRKEPAMGENNIQAVGSVDSEARGTAMYQMFQNQLFKTSDSSTTSAAAVTAAQPEKAEKSIKSEKTEEAAKA